MILSFLGVNKQTLSKSTRMEKLRDWWCSNELNRKIKTMNLKFEVLDWAGWKQKPRCEAWQNKFEILGK